MIPRKVEKKMQASLKTMGRERSLRKVTNERDDELALFLEMRRREKENNLLLLPSNNNNISNNNSDELDACLLGTSRFVFVIRFILGLTFFPFKMEDVFDGALRLRRI